MVVQNYFHCLSGRGAERDYNGGLVEEGQNPWWDQGAKPVKLNDLSIFMHTLAES